MHGAVRKNKKISLTIKKYSPKWFIKAVVKVKGTGVLERPRSVVSSNPSTLNCTIATNNFGSFCTANSCKYDEPVQAVYRGEQYEPQTVEYIKDLKLTGDIVHAGAYFGDTIPALATSILPNAKIWTFEPNRESYRCAQITILLNDLSSVVLQNIGLGKKTEKVFLQTTAMIEGQPHLGGTSKIINNQEFKSKELCEEIEIRRLDDLIPKDRKISLLHLDVEGFESEVLYGATEIIQKWSPVIIVEVNNEEVYKVMEGLGYTFVEGLEQREWREGFRNAVFKKEVV